MHDFRSVLLTDRIRADRRACGGKLARRLFQAANIKRVALKASVVQGAKKNGKIFAIRWSSMEGVPIRNGRI
jgi:hypothetical protein